MCIQYTSLPYCLELRIKNTSSPFPWIYMFQYRNIMHSKQKMRGIRKIVENAKSNNKTYSQTQWFKFLLRLFCLFKGTFGLEGMQSASFQQYQQQKGYSVLSSNTVTCSVRISPSYHKSMFIIYFVLIVLLQNINIILPYALKYACVYVCLSNSPVCRLIWLLKAL